MKDQGWLKMEETNMDYNNNKTPGLKKFQE